MTSVTAPLPGGRWAAYCEIGPVGFGESVEDAIANGKACAVPRVMELRA